MSNKVVVLEVTSKYLRAGYAGDHSPRFEIPNSCISSYAEALESIRHLFLNVMLLKAKEFSVLLIEDIYLRKAQQDIIATVLLQDIQVSSLSVQSKLHLAMVASGLTSGVIVHIGFEESYTICFAEGRPMLNSLKWCQTSRQLSLGSNEKLDSDSDEISSLLVGSLKLCNCDIRVSVASGIIVCGEGSCIPDITSTICSKATSLIQNDNEFEDLIKLIDKLSNKILSAVISPFNTVLLSWIGGSIFASLTSNQKTFLKLAQLSKSNSKSSDGLVLPDWRSLRNASWY